MKDDGTFVQRDLKHRSNAAGRIDARSAEYVTEPATQIPGELRCIIDTSGRSIDSPAEGRKASFESSEIAVQSKEKSHVLRRHVTRYERS